jgi:putative membrane protein
MWGHYSHGPISFLERFTSPGYFWGGGMFIFPLIMLVVVLVIIYMISDRGDFRPQWQDSGQYPKSDGASETALDILKKRNAKGEISKDEFEQMKKDLERREGIMKRLLMFFHQGLKDLEAVAMTYAISWTLVFWVILSSGCMMHGMKKGGNMMDDMMGKSTEKVQRINREQVIDKMIKEAIYDFNEKQININSIAVWDINSKTAGLDVETIRLKLISQLVAQSRFNVISRDRLKELLDEQNLSLSGTIDEHSAVEIGKLIGVEGFIDGYCSLEDNQFILSLSLIETKRGVILWAKIIEVTLSD